jgi:hypothetical protein
VVDGEAEAPNPEITYTGMLVLIHKHDDAVLFVQAADQVRCLLTYLLTYSLACLLASFLACFLPSLLACLKFVTCILIPHTERLHSRDHQSAHAAYWRQQVCTWLCCAVLDIAIAQDQNDFVGSCDVAC